MANIVLLPRLVSAYVALVVATLVALAVLSVLAPAQASTDAWVHAAVVTVFAVLSPCGCAPLAGAVPAPLERSRSSPPCSWW